MSLRFAILLLAVSPPCAVSAGEIATGHMLGPRYNQTSFYERSSPRDKWRQTYEDGPYRKQVRGKLLGLQAAYALFQDQWLPDPDFDPNHNTDRLIEALDRYRRYGVSVIAVSLQGGRSPYRTGGPEARSGQVRDGEQGGALISAFAPDGSLDPGWIQRLKRLLDAADQRGLAVALTYFTPDQDEIFESPEAIVAAARNMTRWLIENDARNVIIDVADRWDLESEIWDFGRFVPRNIGSLVIDIRDQFNSAAFTLPIGAGSGNELTYPSSLARICDVILVRNGAPSAAQRIYALDHLAESERPVMLFGGDPLPSLVSDRAAGAVFAAPKQTDLFPFAYGAEDDDTLFLPLLEQIATLALRKPPQPESESR
jgi:hypothetical protein